MVFLDFNGSSCGATLIHPKYILTAVHCVYRKPLPKIVIGAHDKTDRGNLQGRAKRIILFPQFYKPIDYNNDIAIIELEEEIPISDRVRPICLPPKDSFINPSIEGTTCVAAGWGSISSKKIMLPDMLHDVDIELIERNTCLKIPGYTNQISEKMVCGGHLEGGKDSCQGDSGGPLMCQLKGPGSPWIIYGITSWGVGCARAYTPGVYVKVSVFIDWIEEQTGVEPGLEVESYRNLLPYEPNVKTIKEIQEEAANPLANANFGSSFQSEADTWELQSHVIGQKTCGGELYGPFGVITSDGYPYRYQPNQSCKWVISARNPDNKIVLKFKVLDLDHPRECFLNDNIMVFDDNNVIIGTAQCYLAPQTTWTVSSKGFLTLYFNTNQKNEGTGFLVEYSESIDEEENHEKNILASRTCDENWLLKSDSSEIKQLSSPGWPLNYPLNTQCFWKIESPSELHIVNLQFKSIIMEEPDVQGNCEFDYARVYRGNNDFDPTRKLAELCGSITTELLTDNIYTSDPGQSLFVTFQSDNKGNGRGFSAFYMAALPSVLPQSPTLSPTMEKYVNLNSKNKIGSSNSRPKKGKKKKFGRNSLAVRLWKLPKLLKRKLNV